MTNSSMSSPLALVRLQGVSRVYRSRVHAGTWWRQLVKPDFIEHLALSEASLEIHAGQCLGLVGPNGAGKSTLVKLLTGLLHPDSGHINVLGFEPAKRQSEMLNQMGAVFGHKSSLWWDLPVKHSFEAIQKIYQTPPDIFDQDARRYAKLLRIDHLMDRAVRQLSLGERIKCELVLALAHQPRLLLLDEPTIGVDMESKQQLRTAICQILQEKEIAILLTSHDVNDLLTCCTHIALLQSCELFYHNTLNKLLESFNITADNSRGLEDSLIETFRSRRNGDEEIEFGSALVAAGVSEDDDEDD